MTEKDTFRARLCDLCSRAERRFEPCFTHFLTPEEQNTAHLVCREYPDVFCLDFGGFDGAERKIVGFFPADIYICPSSQNENDAVYAEYLMLTELCYIKVAGSGYRRFSHRDILGSIMSLGAKRETIGDILVSEDEKSAFLVCDKKVAPFLCENLTSVANDKVKTEMSPKDSLPDIKKRYADLSLTLASLRIDALVASVASCSRENGKRMISNGRVSVNHSECTSPDRAFAQGDIISVKGVGKFLVEAFLGKSVKGRYRVIVRKYM